MKIQMEQLSMTYPGGKQALRDVSLTLESPCLVGLLGPNGAGKSTLMKLLTAGLLPTAGGIRIDGQPLLKCEKQLKASLGYLPQAFGLYDELTVYQFLDYMAALKGICDSRQAVKEAIMAVNLKEKEKARIRTLSGGQRQRVGIAQALLGSPRVIILDEPTVGLDPLQIIEIRELIRQLGQTHTVLFSSHILSEVQTICDQILMIAHGKLAAFGAPDELESRLLTPNEITLTAEGTEEQVRALLDGIGAITGRSITAEEGGLVTARLKTGREASLHDVSRALFFAFAGAGVPLLEMALKKANLEDIFIELTEQSAEAPAAAEGEEGQA